MMRRYCHHQHHHHHHHHHQHRHHRVSMTGIATRGSMQRASMYHRVSQTGIALQISPYGFQQVFCLGDVDLA